MLDKLWLIPIAPFIGFLLNGLFGKRAGKRFVTAVAILFSLAAAVFGTIATIQYTQTYHHGERHLNVVYNWFDSGGVGADIAFQLDPLSIVMLMVVTWIGFLIHVYSVGYMHDDEGYWRYFAYLNLFLTAMLILVLGSSYLFMFVGWEGVGLCSYLLIGYYYQTDYAPAAGKKAFVVNRIGDFGFLVAMFLMFAHFGSVDFARVSDLAAGGGVPSWLLASICLLLFLGACGKSAQIPLYVWLPDAMAGPTPVSALIHAATMVTAGVYMVARSNVLFRLSPEAMMVVAIVGGLTALFAATIGIRQFDIKKVLAYSTVSQLGFMFIGVGVGAFAAGIFHLVTHAFFKACLFLGSGSVIHAMGGEQDIRKMGGLRERIPHTYRTFAIATYAIAGLPLAAGFFSKDEILASAWSTPFFPGVGKLVWLLGTLAAFCTAFYMYRLLYLTFHGHFRGTHEQEHHLHESPPSMVVPLWILAVLSIFGGLLNIPHAIHVPGAALLGNWLHAIVPEIEGTHGVIELAASTEVLVALVSTLVALAGWWVARSLYREKQLASDEAFEARTPAVARAIENKWYVDEMYEAAIVRPLERLSLAFWKVFDAIIDGIAAMLGYVVAGFGDILRFLQTGNVRNYALMFFLGVIVFIAFFA
ncbi:MAG TPA: NADH-quinone oxidoreductase subunit L [Thermoanaerobaculia bacterium]|nr:NADH-quinone oxidoreductase subunit L [Thermoanaerobaculia bacterium]